MFEFASGFILPCANSSDDFYLFRIFRHLLFFLFFSMSILTASHRAIWQDLRWAKYIYGNTGQRLRRGNKCSSSLIFLSMGIVGSSLISLRMQSLFIQENFPLQGFSCYSLSSFSWEETNDIPMPSMSTVAFIILGTPLSLERRGLYLINQDLVIKWNALV